MYECNIAMGNVVYIVACMHCLLIIMQGIHATQLHTTAVNNSAPV